MDEKCQFLSLHASYLPIQVLKTSLVSLAKMVTLTNNIVYKKSAQYRKYICCYLAQPIQPYLSYVKSKSLIFWGLYLLFTKLFCTATLASLQLGNCCRVIIKANVEFRIICCLTSLKVRGAN